MSDVTVIAPISIQGDSTKVVVRAHTVLNGFKTCSTTDRDLINAAAKLGGFVVYNTTTAQLEEWNGSAWVAVGGGDGTVFQLSGPTNALVLAHASGYLDVSHTSATQLTIPPHSSVAFPTITLITGIQGGAGQLTFVAGAGVTIRTPETLSCRKIYSSWALKYRPDISVDTWDLTGDLEAA